MPIFERVTRDQVGKCAALTVPHDITVAVHQGANANQRSPCEQFSLSGMERAKALLMCSSNLRLDFVLPRLPMSWPSRGSNCHSLGFNDPGSHECVNLGKIEAP